MNVYQINSENAKSVALLMHRIKPEWWPAFEDAYGQLTDIHETIKTVGWYMGEDSERPKGWILCRELVGYRALEMECSGFDDDGKFKLEHKLGSLFQTAERYAKSKGYLTFRFIDPENAAAVLTPFPIFVTRNRTERQPNRSMLS